MLLSQTAHKTHRCPAVADEIVALPIPVEAEHIHILIARIATQVLFGRIDLVRIIGKENLMASAATQVIDSETPQRGILLVGTAPTSPPEEGA